MTRSIQTLCAALLLVSSATLGAAQDDPWHTTSTFSIVGVDPATGEMGVAVQSRYFAVGAVVPWAEPGVGVVATQAAVNTGYGPKALRLLEQGLTAAQVAERLLAEDTFPRKTGRQFAIVDSRGGIAVHTGSTASDWAGHRQGTHYSAQGNILAGPAVVQAMGDAFERTRGELAERLMAALEAGQEAGGDRRGQQSAAILVIREGAGRGYDNDYYIRLHVDDHAAPIAELRRLLNMQLGMNALSESRQRLGRDDLAGAAELARRGIALLPESPDGHLTLGFVHYLRGERAEALRTMREAQRLSPGFRTLFDSYSGFMPRFPELAADEAFLRELFPSGRQEAGPDAAAALPLGGIP